MDENALVIARPTMAQVSHQADRAFVRKLLEEYHETKSEQTLRRQVADLALFASFLESCGIAAGDFYHDIDAWDGMSFGLLEGFKRWMLDRSYSIGSINVRVATVRRYCDLAFRAGVISEEAHALIKTVKGILGDEARNIDEKRGIVRNGYKKAQPTPVTDTQAESLKAQCDPRDGLLLCLMIDHGLRCGEITALRVGHFDLLSGELRFYRHKVDKTQNHRLTSATLAYAQEYIGGLDKRAQGERVFSGAGPDGSYPVRSINKRVRALGRVVDIATLSPHDLRHYWATHALKKGTSVRALQQAGGWNSPYMPLRYAADTEIANEGVIL